MQLQYNVLTNIPYEGKNQANLMVAKNRNKFNSNAWLTFLQAKSQNLIIKKGSHGTPIVKYVDYEEEKLTNGKVEIETKQGPRYYVVFNLDQTEKSL